MREQHDFSQGSVSGNILSLAIPMTLAQLINVLYNIVDRIYIGHIPHASAQALTGIGLALPIITMITAFANLFGMGGAPLCSIARGSHEEKRAGQIMGNSFSMLLISGFLLMAVCLLFKRPLLYLFGASDDTFPYANDYLTIYLIGTIFVMISLGMNNFINSQGFGRTGMLTVLLGAVLNLILDPILIFVLNLGVRGAAIATILSQAFSAAWVMKFLTGSKALLRLTRSSMVLNGKLIREITGLGLSSFVMCVTNSSVQIMCNATLQQYGGDLYVGIMTVVNSVREVITMPVMGMTSGAQPVIGYNYGAKCYGRVKSWYPVYDCSLYPFHHYCLGAAVLFPRYVPQDVYQRKRFNPGGHSCYEDLLLRNLPDGLAVRRTVNLRRSGEIKTGCILFPVSESNYCDSPDAFVACHRRSGNSRGVSCGAGFQSDWGTACFATMVLTVLRRLGHTAD